MKTITNGSLSELLLAANTGPFMEAEIFTLTNNGKVRVTCNWLYSSLNCDPKDTSSFIWSFSKIDDNTISLSPVNSCISKTIYASVRDDIDYYLQVQAPYSADWITAVGRDEKIGFKMHDLSIAQLTGFNGKYITLDSSQSNHGGHAGYRLRSIGDNYNESAQWYISIKSSLQDGINFSGVDHSLESIKSQLANCNIKLSDTAINTLVKNVNA